jgi:hypothetical protein
MFTKELNDTLHELQESRMQNDKAKKRLQVITQLIPEKKKELTTEQVNANISIQNSMQCFLYIEIFLLRKDTNVY